MKTMLRAVSSYVGHIISLDFVLNWEKRIAGRGLCQCATWYPLV